MSHQSKVVFTSPKLLDFKQVNKKEMSNSCIELDQIGSCWIKLDHAGSNWIKLDQTGSCWIRLDQIGSCWIKLDWTGMDMVGAEWSRLEMITALLVSLFFLGCVHVSEIQQFCGGGNKFAVTRRSK